MSNSAVIQFIDNLGVNPEPERKQASSGLTIEQITDYSARSWKDWLVKHQKDRYYNKDHRYEVMNTDPMATVWTKRFFKLVTSKPFKSYDTDMEGQPVEIMSDVWERWEELNMNDAFREIGKYCLWDGYCLARFWLSPEMALAYKAYGYYHCPPEYWVRINARETPLHNRIQAYYISYFPKPLGDAYCPTHNMHTEDFYMYPTAQLPQDGYQMFHFTRGEFNDGFGDPLGLAMWATITKLRKVAWYDFKGACRYPIVELPIDMDPDDMEAILDAWRNWDEMEGMGILKRINPNTGETEDFPRVYERTPDQTGATTKADPSSGGSLLRNAEYARMLMITGNSEAFYVGSQPGELESSKITLTVDDRAIIGEFQMYIKIIKKLLQFLLMIGGLEGCEQESLEKIQTGQFDIKCHIEWEVLENMIAAAEMAEEEASMKAEGQKQEAERHNAYILDVVLNCVRTNVNTPGMIPVQSSWIQGIGVLDKTLWFKMKDWPWYAGFQFTDNETAFEKYLSAAKGTTTKWGKTGSTGAWVWENIWEQGVKPFSRGPRPTQPGINMGISGIRYSRDPFSYIGGPVTQLDTQEWAAARQELVQGKPGLVGTGGTGAAMQLTGVSHPPRLQTPEVVDTSAGARIEYPAFTPEERPRKKKPRGGTAPAARPARVASFLPDLDRISWKKLNAQLKQQFGVGISKNAFTNLRIWENSIKFAFRYNSISVGKPMDFDIDLHYTINGKHVKERACKREFRKINQHIGDIVLYEDQEHGGSRTKVGEYEFWWDEDADEPRVRFNYDKAEVMKLVPDDSNIALRIKAGLEPEMSTEYLADTIEHEGIRYQMNIRNVLGEKRFERIAIVNYGNCPAGICEFETIENSEGKDESDRDHSGSDE